MRQLRCGDLVPASPPSARRATGPLNVSQPAETATPVARAFSSHYHQILAKRLRRSMLDDALRLLWKWRDQGRIDRRYAAEWEDLLRQPLPVVRARIVEDSQRGRDLRQNSPLAGMLSESERKRILTDIC